MNQEKIILPGGAGLVGQNLVVRLKERGYNNLIVLDKHRANLEVLRQLHPDIVVEYADLAEPGEWQRHFSQEIRSGIKSSTTMPLNGGGSPATRIPYGR